MNMSAPCQNHPEEPVSYYCFTCHCPPICSECVIHGEHQGHDVQTIRKSLPEIQEHFEQLLHQISQRIDEMAMQENRLDGKKREVNELTQGLKHQVSSMFEDLRMRMDAKERELMTMLDKQSI